MTTQVVDQNKILKTLENIQAVLAEGELAVLSGGGKTAVLYYFETKDFEDIRDCIQHLKGTNDV